MRLDDQIAEAAGDVQRLRGEIIDLGAVADTATRDRPCQIAAKPQQVGESQEFLIAHVRFRLLPMDWCWHIEVMTIPRSISFYSRFDVQASAARAAVARRLAAEQAEAVAACKDGASDTTIDLFFLLQESVLVFDEAHARMAFAAEERKPASAGAHRPPRRRRRALVAITNAVAFLAFLMAAATLVEILDPAPMDVLAIGVDMRSP